MELLEQKKKVSNAEYFQVAEGVWGMRTLFVNLYMIQDLSTDEWVLIDAGLKGFEGSIVKMAEDIFGEGAKPSAVILTHGHFDHTGALEELLTHWKVPVFAHKLELPYLTGKSSYPPADPTAGGGMMAWMSWAYPVKPIDITDTLEEAPEGYLRVLNDWQVIHTPGHTPGHISLFRENDRVLIAGDAFVTTQAESLLSTIMQKKKVCGPPNYLTPDWISAYKSIKKLAGMNPEIVASGHGRPLEGKELKNGLNHLISYFYHEAMPDEGRYIKDPARANEEGVIYIPPLNTNTLLKLGISVLVGFAASLIFVGWLKRRN